MIRERVRSFTSLLDLQRPALPGEQGRLAQAVSIDDLHRLVRRRTPGLALDYVDGGAITEGAVAGNREAFAAPAGAPLPQGDRAGERGHRPAGTAPRAALRHRPHRPDRLMRIEAVAQAGPGARKWFQLHVRRGRENSTGLLQCAWENGCDTLVVTADTPSPGGSCVTSTTSSPCRPG